ncbi:MAG: hypothetical protein IKU36_02170 [Bacteroidales bacterium]|nr:hypothetical protein [Bacteroidales bacterium]
MTIKIDSKYLEALRDYLEALSTNRLHAVEVLHTKFDLAEQTSEKVKINCKSNELLGEAKAYRESAKKIDELLKELLEKFTVEEGS